MRIWYQINEGTGLYVNQYPILEVSYDAKEYEQNLLAFNQELPFDYVDLDQTTPDNRTQCIDIWNRRGLADRYGKGKYYVKKSDLTLWERGNWVASPGTYTYNPANDILVPFIVGPNKQDFRNRAATAIQRCQQIENQMNTSPTNQQVILGLRDIAIMLPPIIRRLVDIRAD